MMHAPLTVSVETDVGRSVLRVVGDIDATTTDLFDGALHDLCRTVPSPSTVVVDLYGVDFIGTTALQTFQRAVALCRRRGVALELISANRSVVRALELIGVSSAKNPPVGTDVSDAVAVPPAAAP